MRINLLYGVSSIPLNIPQKNLVGLIEPKELPHCLDPTLEIERVIENPICAVKPSKKASSKDKVAIVVDDHYRTAPSHLLVPPILKDLNSVGVKDENISIIFGSGTHEFVSSEWAVRLLGEEVVRKVGWMNHDCRASDQVEVGRTSFGTRVRLDRVFVEADLRVLTGDVGFHYYAGYGGGRKSVLPGVSSLETIENNHARFYHPLARAGILTGNPVHEDMVEAAKLANVDFVLNAVTNAKADIVQVFAGDLEHPFLEGVKLVDAMYKVPVKEEADIVVVTAGGSPNDLNLYHAHKAIQQSLNVVKKGGSIILLAECPDGYGSQNWRNILSTYLGNKTTLEQAREETKNAISNAHNETYSKVITQMESTVKKRFMMGIQAAWHFIRALEKVSIYLVSNLPEKETKKIFRITKSKTPNLALHDCLKAHGQDSTVLVIPYGSITLPTVT